MSIYSTRVFPLLKIPGGKHHLGSRSKQGAQTEFLPGALTVQERPPSPSGRSLLWLLLTLFSTSVVWAFLGEVDIVVTAPGRIVPSGQVKLVQAPEAGGIVAIKVKEGDLVQSGDILVELDPTFAEADDTRLRESLYHNQLQLAWREAFEDWLAAERLMAVELQLPDSTLPADVTRLRDIFSQHQREAIARLAGYAKDLAANHAQRNAVLAQREQAQAGLTILTQRVDAYKTLVERQYGSRVQYLELLQQQAERERSLPVLAANTQELEESAAAITARTDAAEGELRKQNLLQLARLSSERNTLEQEIRKSQQRRLNLQIVAPVSGTVQELVLHTQGGVVTPAQVLMKIVPQQSQLEVEAFLQNKDIGFVEQGQVAAIKIDTFNFTKFGLIDANIIDIGKDAVNDETRGWVFKARLALGQESISVNGKPVPLSPGMSVTAEFITGRRRLIEFLFSPLLRYKHESLGER